MSKTVQEAHEAWVQALGMKDRNERWDDYCNIRDGLSLGTYEHIRARREALEAAGEEERAKHAQKIVTREDERLKVLKNPKVLENAEKLKAFGRLK
jgi:alanine dehydrogenase